jgi:hypothetical protein
MLILVEHFLTLAFNLVHASDVVAYLSGQFKNWSTIEHVSKLNKNDGMQNSLGFLLFAGSN